MVRMKGIKQVAIVVLQILNGKIVMCCKIHRLLNKAIVAVIIGFAQFNRTFLKSKESVYYKPSGCAYIKRAAFINKPRAGFVWRVFYRCIIP